MCHEIVGQRPLLGNVAHKHGDGAANGLIDINDEDLVIVANKNRAAAARRQDGADLHLDHRFVHPVRTLSARGGKTSDPVRATSSDKKFSFRRLEYWPR